MSDKPKHPAVIIALPVVLLAFGLLAWFNGRTGLELYRWIFGFVVVVVSLPVLWAWRRQTFKLLVTLFIAGALLTVLCLTSPSINHLVAESFISKAVVWYIAVALSVLLIQKGLPLMKQPSQAVGAVVAGGLLSLVLFIVSLAWWLQGVETYAIRKNPVARSAAEIAELFQQSWGSRLRGVFVPGVIGQPEERAKEDANGVPQYLAWYSYSQVGFLSSAEDSWFPIEYELRLEDGSTARVQSISGARETWNWPEGGRRQWSRGLRNGDPVVVWADPGELRAMGSGEKSPALNYTRVIAYGTLEDFINGYVASAIHTARVFGWVGLGLIPLSLIPGMYGFLHWRRLRKGVNL